MCGLPIGCAQTLLSSVPEFNAVQSLTVPDPVPPKPKPRSNSSKQLVIDNIPETMDANDVKEYLDFMFTDGEHVITDFSMVGSTAYLKFKNVHCK